MTALRLFANPAVAPLLTSRLISSAGVGFGQVAFVWGMKSNGYSAAAISMVAACKAIPALLILAGGLLGDRFKRHHVLAAAELAASLTWVAIGVCLLNRHTPTALLCALALVSGTTYFIFMPAVRSITADLLPSGQRHCANALVGQTEAIGALIGLTAAGVVVTSAGAAPAAILKAAACLVSAALLLRLKITRRRTATPGPLSELAAGWKHFADHRWMWAMALQFTTAVIATATLVEIIGPVFMDDTHRGAQTWGVVSACEALGAVAGALLAVRWKPRHPIRLAVLLLIFAGAPPLAIGLSASSAVIAASMLVSGVVKAVYMVLWVTQLQQALPIETIARVNGWNFVPAYALAPIALVLVGPLVKADGAGVAALVLTASVLASTVVATLLLLAGASKAGEPDAARADLLAVP
ncbi:MFS transporter [Actinomadura rupiterrae]|uniref:MFS transporter n=1 Tax=Actinomadura rupiterrae TaxID=559627 RepID=UPI0020A476D2|nr:MFS transporter [Actinomadura rupiterrae]MCP2337952.1 putative MFS family arabinose efflux permease [Actinomadura rupiterrae]